VPHHSLVVVLLVLLRRGEVLLARRVGTDHGDGWWSLPGGRLEAGEDALAAAVREAREETGLFLDRRALDLVTTVHWRGDGGEAPIGLFFRARSWTGTPVNAEPDGCACLAWHPLEALPARLLPEARAGLVALRGGETFVAIGRDQVPGQSATPDRAEADTRTRRF
jgi:8-oxo-dGTP pyrophosphatase MutT (NUDIX family)